MPPVQDDEEHGGAALLHQPDGGQQQGQEEEMPQEVLSAVSTHHLSQHTERSMYSPPLLSLCPSAARCVMSEALLHPVGDGVGAEQPEGVALSVLPAALHLRRLSPPGRGRERGRGGGERRRAERQQQRHAQEWGSQSGGRHSPSASIPAAAAAGAAEAERVERGSERVDAAHSPSALCSHLRRSMPLRSSSSSPTPTSATPLIHSLTPPSPA